MPTAHRRGLVAGTGASLLALLAVLLVGDAWAGTVVTKDPPTGTVTVDKVLVGDAVLASDATIRVRCEQVPDFGDAVYDETRTVPAGATEVTLSFDGIPTPADCVVSEVDDGGNVAVDVAVDGLPAEFRLNPNEEYQLGVVNEVTTRTGALEVRKESRGPVADLRGDVVMEVVCTDPAGRSATEQVTFEPGRIVVVGRGGIVAGSTCTVSELRDGAPDGVVVTTDGSPQTVTIAEDDTATVTITNTYALGTGTVAVTKVIDGAAADDRGDVTLELVCDGGVVETVAVPAGAGGGTFALGSVEVPAGSVCTVVEPADGSTATATAATGVAPSTVTVVAGETVGLTVTNTYTSPPGDPVDVRVDKVLAGDTGRQGPVVVVVDCGGRRGAIALPAGATAGGTVTVADVDPGATCTIAEPLDGENDAVSLRSTTGLGAELVPTGDGFTVVNEYELQDGSVRVAKEVAGAAADARGDLTVAIACTDGSTASATFAAGDPITDVVLSGVADGATCTVAEPLDGGTSSVAVITEGAAAVVGVVAGEESVVTVTNTYTTRVGVLVGLLALRGNAEPFRGDVAVVVACGGRDPVSIDAPAGGRATPVVLTGLPHGTVCELTQTADGDTPDIDTATTPGTAQSVTIDRPLTVAGFVDVYTADPGSLTVVKALAGDDDERGDVTILVACDSITSITTFAPDAPTPLSVAVEELLPGESCVVTELEDGGSPALAVTTTVTPSPEVEVGPAAREVVTVTNEYAASLAVVGSHVGLLGGLALGALAAGLLLLHPWRRRMRSP